MRAALLWQFADPYPRHQEGSDPDGRRSGRLPVMQRVAIRTRQAICGLGGHRMARHFEPGRMCLRCTACGRETPGWTIDVRPAFRRIEPPRARRANIRHMTPPADGAGSNERAA
jgi:hypothetical protein